MFNFNQIRKLLSDGCPDFIIHCQKSYQVVEKQLVIQLLEAEQPPIMTFFANLKFGGTLFSKIMPNFCRPHSISIHKLLQFP